MEIYTLTTVGDKLRHSINNTGKPRQKIIYFLAKVHRATKEQILENVPDATLGDIAVLKRSNPPIIEIEMGG